MGKRVNTAVWVAAKRYWKINVQKDGQRKSFYSSKQGRIGQREANAKADAWLDDNISNSKQRIDSLYIQYIQSISSTVEKNKAESNGKLYILPALGNRRISSITDNDFQSIIDRAAIKGVNGKPLSKKTLTTLSYHMKNFIKFCRRKRLTTETLEILTIPKNAKTQKKRILQPRDLITLFSSDTTYMYGNEIKDTYIHAYRFAVLTGLRPGELMGLERGDLDGSTVRLRRSINEDGAITDGKNKNAQRQFMLTKLAMNELQLQIQQTKGERIFEINSQSTFRHRWARYCEHNGIPYISPYEMRHTFVSMVKSLPEGEVKALVGHSKSMDTWGIYSHEIAGDQKRTAEKLEAIFQCLLQDAKNSVV